MLPRYYLQVNAWMIEMESADSRSVGDDLNSKVILFVQVMHDDSIVLNINYPKEANRTWWSWEDALERRKLREGFVENRSLVLEVIVSFRCVIL